MIQSILDVWCSVFPLQCVSCRKPVHRDASSQKTNLKAHKYWKEKYRNYLETHICQSCIEEIEDLQVTTSSCAICMEGKIPGVCSYCKNDSIDPFILRSLFYYSGSIRNIIFAAKAHNDLRAVRLMSHALNERTPILLKSCNWNSITYCPSHKESNRRREVYIVRELARLLSTAMKKPLIEASFTHDGTQRGTLSLEERLQKRSPESKFDIPKNHSIIELSPCLLIDDVLTSGTTLYKTKNSLSAIGISAPYAITIARSPNYAKFQKLFPHSYS